MIGSRRTVTVLAVVATFYFQLTYGNENQANIINSQQLNKTFSINISVVTNVQHNKETELNKTMAKIVSCLTNLGFNQQQNDKSFKFSLENTNSSTSKREIKKQNESTTKATLKQIDDSNYTFASINRNKTFTTFSPEEIKKYSRNRNRGTSNLFKRNFDNTKSLGNQIKLVTNNTKLFDRRNLYRGYYFKDRNNTFTKKNSNKFILWNDDDNNKREIKNATKTISVLEKNLIKIIMNRWNELGSNSKQSVKINLQEESNEVVTKKSVTKSVSVTGKRRRVMFRRRKIPQKTFGLKLLNSTDLLVNSTNKTVIKNNIDDNKINKSMILRRDLHIIGPIPSGFRGHKTDTSTYDGILVSQLELPNISSDENNDQAFSKNDNIFTPTERQEALIDIHMNYENVLNRYKEALEQYEKLYVNKTV